MGKKRKKLLLIYGPTAIGKTRLGINLAKKLKGEIVSADSRQIYSQMDIGTGKDLEKGAKFHLRNRVLGIEREKGQVGFYPLEGVAVWLLDVVSPTFSFSAYQWAQLAERVVADIWRRGKLPLIVGGSGFYLKVLLDGLDTAGIPPDWRLRKELDRLPLSRLQSELKKISPSHWQAMNQSDRQNRRRLIRAIEISRRGGKKKKNFLPPIDLLAFSLTAPVNFLRKRIKKRVKQRLSAGLLKEIKRLLKKYSWGDPGLNSLAYKEFKFYWQKKEGLDEAVSKWERDEFDYAKRQRLWFKRDDRFLKVDVSRPNFEEKINKLIKTWYS